MLRMVSIALALSIGAGCAAEAGDGPDTDDPIDPTDPTEPTDPMDPEPAPAILEIYPLDVWGQMLPSSASLRITPIGSDDVVPSEGAPVRRLALYQAGSLHVSLAAPDHHDITVTIAYDGTATASGLRIHRQQDNQAVALSHELRRLTPDAEPTAVHTLYLGLHHRWFSAQGRPARRGNEVELLMDGEEAWGKVHRELTGATNSIAMTTWWWESGFELVRDWDTHADSTLAERRANSILGILDSSPATKRVIVGQFIGQDGLLSWMTADSELRARGAAAGDGFEFMGQANETSGVFWFELDRFRFSERVKALHPSIADRSFETDAPIESDIDPRQVDLNEWPVDIEVPHASYHQKFAIIDNVAFVGGMNLRRVDWDTSAHLVFDHRRMLIDASTDDRYDVVDRDAEPDAGPRKDYMVRIEGPASQDVADVFARRWQHLRAQGVEYSDNSSAYAVTRELADAGDVQVQITTTMPEPFWEHSIAETWLNAVQNAERYIFIEDQYFRAPMLFDAIVDRMNDVPELKLVVITKPVSEWADPGCAWTNASHQQFLQQFPDRYQMLQVRSFATSTGWGIDETDAHFVNIDVHSKLLIVDDHFLSVGSANKNNRGMIYEAEMNVAVVDTPWVSAARRRVISNLLGVPSSDDADAWFAQVRAAAAANDAVHQAWDAEGMDLNLNGAALPAQYRPRGFLYSLELRRVEDCLIESVGPDMT